MLLWDHFLSFAKNRDCETHKTAKKRYCDIPWNSAKHLPNPWFIQNHALRSIFPAVTALQIGLAETSWSKGLSQGNMASETVRMIGAITISIHILSACNRAQSGLRDRNALIAFTAAEVLRAERPAGWNKRVPWMICNWAILKHCQLFNFSCGLMCLLRTEIFVFRRERLRKITFYNKCHLKS